MVQCACECGDDLCRHPSECELCSEKDSSEIVTILRKIVQRIIACLKILFCSPQDEIVTLLQKPPKPPVYEPKIIGAVPKDAEKQPSKPVETKETPKKNGKDADKQTSKTVETKETPKRNVKSKPNNKRRNQVMCVTKILKFSVPKYYGKLAPSVAKIRYRWKKKGPRKNIAEIFAGIEHGSMELCSCDHGNEYGVVNSDNFNKGTNDSKIKTEMVQNLGLH